MINPWVDEVIEAKLALIREILAPRGPRTVRVTFACGADLARVDEMALNFVIAPVIGWLARDVAEDYAALYAAARELPISRMDAA